MSERKPVTMTADYAQDLDVVYGPDGTVYQLIGDGVWGTIQPVGTMSGPLFQPEGELTLIGRKNKPVGT